MQYPRPEIPLTFAIAGCREKTLPGLTLLTALRTLLKWWIKLDTPLKNSAKHHSRLENRDSGKASRLTALMYET